MPAQASAYKLKLKDMMIIRFNIDEAGEFYYQGY